MQTITGALFSFSLVFRMFLSRPTYTGEWSSARPFCYFLMFLALAEGETAIGKKLSQRMLLQESSHQKHEQMAADASSAGNSTENCNLVLNFLPTWRSEMHVCRNSRILRRQPLWSNFATACVSGEFNTTTASSDHPPNSFSISFITQSNAMSFSPFPQLNKRFRRISAEFQWTISTVHDSAFCNQWGNSSASDLVLAIEDATRYRG